MEAMETSNQLFKWKDILDVQDQIYPLNRITKDPSNELLIKIGCI